VFWCLGLINRIDTWWFSEKRFSGQDNKNNTFPTSFLEEKRHMAVQWRVFLPTDCLTLLMSPSKELWRHWRACSSLCSYDRWLIVTLFGLLPAGLKKEVKTGSIRILTDYTERSTRDRCDRAISAHACWDLCVIVRISSASH